MCKQIQQCYTLEKNRHDQTQLKFRKLAFQTAFQLIIHPNNWTRLQLKIKQQLPQSSRPHAITQLMKTSTVHVTLSHRRRTAHHSHNRGNIAVGIFVTSATEISSHRVKNLGPHHIETLGSTEVHSSITMVSLWFTSPEQRTTNKPHLDKKWSSVGYTAATSKFTAAAGAANPHNTYSGDQKWWYERFIEMGLTKAKTILCTTQSLFIWTTNWTAIAEI